MYSKTGELIYHAAALGIIHNVEKNTQRFFNKHRDDCISLALHPDGYTCASGELGPRPWICIWDSRTGQEVKTINGGIFKGIDNLNFSPDGRYLACTQMDDDHKITVFDCSDGYKPVATEKGGRETILDIVWANGTEFATIGVKHFKSWTVSGGQLKATKGQFKGGDVLLSAAACNGSIITGNTLGELMIWKGSSCSKVIAAHKGPVDAIAVGKNW